jgi:hypothetical protein
MKSALIVFVAWAALWLAGSWWAAAALQVEIQAAADVVLKDAGPAASGVSAVVSGQKVALTGSLRPGVEADTLVARLQDKTRLPGAWADGVKLNPISQITTSALQQDTRRAGWGLLAADGARALLLGHAHDETEALRISSQLRPLLTGGVLDSRLEADPESYLPQITLTDTTALEQSVRASGWKSGVLAFARWGGKWEVLSLDQPRERLRLQLKNLGVQDQFWNEVLSAEVARLQDVREKTLAARKVEDHQRQLPPGHVVLAVRADTWLIRGELGPGEAAEVLLQHVQQLAGQRRVINQLRVSALRQTNDDARPLVQSLPVVPDGNLARWVSVGTSADGWKIVPLAEIDLEDANSIMPGMLPSSVDHRLMVADVAEAAVWVNSIMTEPKVDMPPSPPAHLFMVIVGTSVFVRGSLPTEALRTQAEQAIKKRYPQLHTEVILEVEPGSVAGESPLQTLGLLPSAPSTDTSGLLAFALVGEPWNTKAARASLLDAQTLAASGLVPSAFPINRLMPEVLDVAPAIMEHLRAFERTAMPGIPPQTIGPK